MVMPFLNFNLLPGRKAWKPHSVHPAGSRRKLQFSLSRINMVLGESHQPKHQYLHWWQYLLWCCCVITSKSEDNFSFPILRSRFLAPSSRSRFQTDLKSNISAGDNHVVMLDDHVRAEPPLGVPLNVAVGVAGIDSCGSLRNENGFYLYPIESWNSRLSL